MHSGLSEPAVRIGDGAGTFGSVDDPGPDARAGVTDYLATHERGHLGRVAYRPEQVGHDPDELRRRFAPYAERFLAGGVDKDGNNKENP